MIMDHLRKLRTKLWAMREVLLAGVFTGAETLVNMGIDLPGSKAMPQWARGLMYMGIVGGAFILRWKASRNKKVDDE